MSTILIATTIAFIVGFLAGGMVVGLNEGLSEGFFGVISFFLRPSLPLYFWLHHARDISGWTLKLIRSWDATYATHDYKTGTRRITDSENDARFVTDGNEWGALFLRENSSVGFSPLFLIPAGLVRLVVRLFGRKVATGLTDNPENGYIFKGLRVAPGLILIRRRPQDVGYMKHMGVFPTFELATETLIERS